MRTKISSFIIHHSSLVLVGICLWLVTASVNARGTARLMDLPPERIDRILERAQSLEVNERIETLSALFVGTPYRRDPLGEGEEGAIDRDPLFRLDRVDCLTFLEELWALLGAKSLEEARRRTRLIRYAEGGIDYHHRLHLSWMQWLPVNEAKGRVVDITREIGGTATLRERKTISGPKQCGGRWKTFCRRLGKRLPVGTVEHDVIPLEHALKIWERIPEGVFLFVVHEDRSYLPYRIKHAGLVVRDEKGHPRLRHASTTHKKVVDVSLFRYLKMLKTETFKWPATGIILVRPAAPGPVRSAAKPSLDQGEEAPAPAQPD